jgi:hypothetical protein
MFRQILQVSGILVILCGSHVLAQTGDGGQPGATMRIGQGARALAMGSAFTAIADDASAIFFNPAGLAQIRKAGVAFAWRAMPLLDRKQGYASIAIPLREEATLGLAWVHSGVGDIVTRSGTGEAGEELSFSESFLSLAFAKQFGRVLSVGGNLHYVHQSLLDVTANTVGLSVGIHTRFDRLSRRPYPDFLQRLTIAASVQHLGMTMRYDSGDYYTIRGLGNGVTTAEQYPFVGRGALSYRLLGDRSLIVSVEGTHVQHQHIRGYAGAEWTPDPRIMIRAGMAQTDPTFGIGIRQPWGNSRISLDYAFITSPVGESADHVLALGIGF